MMGCALHLDVCKSTRSQRILKAQSSERVIPIAGGRLLLLALALVGEPQVADVRLQLETVAAIALRWLLLLLLRLHAKPCWHSPAAAHLASRTWWHSPVAWHGCLRLGIWRSTWLHAVGRGARLPRKLRKALLLGKLAAGCLGRCSAIG